MHSNTHWLILWTSPTLNCPHLRAERRGEREVLTQESVQGEASALPVSMMLGIVGLF